ncbi:MAG: alpha-hydroxy acid oxidase [Aggregatilineales bacterium]
MKQPVNLEDYETLAHEKLSRSAYAYFSSGAADEYTKYDNEFMYEKIQIMPHVLHDVSERDISTTLLNQKIDFPVVIAPMAMAALAHPDKELAMARAAKQANIPMCLSTLSTTTLENVAETDVNGWFQLYVHKDRGVSRALVQRAEAAGYQALVVTVDVPVTGYREALLRQPLILPDGLELANLTDYWHPAEYPRVTDYVAAQFDASLTWADIEQFVTETSLPVFLKGILRADDAIRALDTGIAGMIVSNHGGRQLDTVPATITVLPEIADAINGRCTLMVDGGIRRGTDVLKALACGADAIMLGRPLMWALAADGQFGVETALAMLRHEYDIALALSGCATNADLSRDILRFP